MPLGDLNSNWLYLVAACLAWSLKSWSALWFAEDGRKREAKRRKERLLKMEFATFLQAMIAIPAQIVRSGRQTIVRLLNVNDGCDHKLLLCYFMKCVKMEYIINFS